MRLPRMAILALCLCAGRRFFGALFCSSGSPVRCRASASPAPASPKHGKGTQAAKPATAQLLDINTASEDELRALKGVGDIRAANIIKNRPYKGKDELVQKKIIPPAVYAGIKDKIIAKQQ